MPDFKIEIIVKDVTGRDVDELVEQIENEHGENFDAERGDFTIRASQKEGDNYYARDPGDDDLVSA